MSLAVPAARAGVVALMVLSSTTTTPVAGTPPIVTEASTKLVPEIVIPVPPSGGPERILTENGSRCESSDVLPDGLVAVAEMREPAGVALSVVTLNDAFPDPSVVTCEEPRYVAPWRKSRGNCEQEGLA